MTSAGKSIYYFGLYLYLIGIVLIVSPNLLLRTFQFPETTEVWIRVVGLLTVIIGFYYHRMGLTNNEYFFRLTIFARILVLTAFIAFVLLKFAPAVLIFFGVVDLIGAAWTWFSLRKS